MYCDFKISTWERINIPEDIEDKFIELLKSGDIKSVSDAIWHFGAKANDNYEKLYDVDEQLTPFNNGGAPTIELHTSDNMVVDDIIWDNGRNEN